MSRSDRTEIMVAVHMNSPQAKAICISADGEGKRAVFIARSQIASFHETGKTTRGTDRYGNKVTLPLANMTIPEWLAIKEGLV